MTIESVFDRDRSILAAVDDLTIDWIPTTEAERSHLGTTWLELRGRELFTLAQNIRNEEHFQQLRDAPEKTKKLSISQRVSVTY